MFLLLDDIDSVTCILHGAHACISHAWFLVLHDLHQLSLHITLPRILGNRNATAVVFASNLLFDLIIVAAFSSLELRRAVRVLVYIVDMLSVALAVWGLVDVLFL